MIKINKKYGSIDILKLFMAICVIAIHTHPLENCETQIILDIYNTITTMAVPIFFISLGFFMFTDGEEKQKNRIISTLKKLIKLYLIWTCIYLPITIASFVIRDLDIITSILEFIRGVVFLGENQNSWILWYLLSAIYSISIYYLLVYRVKTNFKSIYLVSICALLLHIMVTIIYSIDFSNSIINLFIKMLKVVLPNQRMLIGMFYVPAGITIAKYKLALKNKQLLYTLSFLCITAINVFVGSTIASIILTVISSLLLFNIVVNLEILTTEFTTKIRIASTVFYFTHMITFSVYSFLTANTFQFYGVEAFVFVLAVSILISLIVVKVKPKSKLIQTIFS